MPAMTAPTVTARKPMIYLKQDSDAEVLVHPSDNDKSVLSSSEAVRAILNWAPISNRLSNVQGQLKLLLDRLQEWCKKHPDRIHRADARFQDYDDILFVVMQKDVPYDIELSEQLSDLDVEIFNDSDFGAIHLNVLGIPRCSFDAAQAFIDLERNICIVEFQDNAEP